MNESEEARIMVLASHTGRDIRVVYADDLGAWWVKRDCDDFVLGEGESLEDALLAASEKVGYLPL